jgi:hypothetical protein
VVVEQPVVVGGEALIGIGHGIEVCQTAPEDLSERITSADAWPVGVRTERRRCARGLW